MTPSPATPGYDYKAFLSYSHAADGQLAAALQRSVERYASPWYRPRSLRVFRDQTGLEITPHLWQLIRRRLDQSEWFVLLASPQAARSQWVCQEVEYWLNHRRADRFMIVLTGGEIDWPDEARDFDWNVTDALPRCLSGAFPEEPFWADLRWAKQPKDLSLRRPAFAQEVARLVAALRGQTLELVLDEDAAQHARTMRMLYAAVAASLTLGLASLAAAVFSLQAKRTAEALAAARSSESRSVEEASRRQAEEARASAERARKEAASAALSAQSAASLPHNRELAMRLAIEAAQIAPTPQAERALRATLALPTAPVSFKAHSGAVASVAFSPDGEWVFTGSEDGTVRLSRRVPPHDAVTYKARDDGDETGIGILSTDATRVLTVARPRSLEFVNWDRGSVRFYDRATGDHVMTFPDRGAVTADVSPDGKHIVTGGFDRAVRLWDVGGKLRFERGADSGGHQFRVLSVSFSRDGKWLVSGSFDDTARVWEASTGEPLAVLAVGKPVDGAIFTSDGEKVLTFSAEGKMLELWDWANSPGSRIAAFEGHEAPIRGYALTPDGRRLVTGSWDNHARVYEVATGRCNYILLHDAFVHAVAISPDGRWAATASGAGTDRDENQAPPDGKVHVWSVDSGSLLTVLALGGSPYTSVAFAPDGKHVAVGNSAGEVHIYPCPFLGPLEDLLALSRSLDLPALSAEQRERYLSGDVGR